MTTAVAKSVSVLDDVSNVIYTRYRVRIRYRDQVLGGVPKSGNSLEWYLNEKFSSDEEKADFKRRVESGALSDDEKAEIREASWNTFERDRNGNLCLWHGNFKACLREVFVTLGLTQKFPIKATKAKEAKSAKVGGAKPASSEGPVLVPARDPSAGGRQTLQHGVHVDPLRLVFLRDNQPIKIADGYVDKVKHITDAAGKRSALGRHDYIDQPEIEMVLKWPTASVFTIDDMKKALAVAQDDGLGACRSQGIGKFDVILLEKL